MKPIRVEPEAKAELEAAAAWYESRREGLGHELIVELDAVFGAIARNPSRFSFYPRVSAHLGVRRAVAGRSRTPWHSSMSARLSESSR
jgi:hypothetical protein